MAEEPGHTGSNRILIVDDDRELCDLLATYLQREGFSTDCAHDGEVGLERALSGSFDLVILDVMLPGIAGFEVLRRLRRAHATPVLMLTARGEDVDRIVGLELGADDYLAKPFNPRELVARIHAILRRAKSPHRTDSERDPPVIAGDLVVDPSRREASYAGRDLAVTTVEFDVLMLLVRSIGRVVSREEISKQALGRPHSPYDRSVDMHMSNLRRKLQRAAGDGVVIKAVRSAGYMFVASSTPGPQRTP
jgi:two-component system, OmpR family, response regulator CpxR